MHEVHLRWSYSSDDIYDRNDQDPPWTEELALQELDRKLNKISTGVRIINPY